MIKIIGCQVHQHISIVANLCELSLLLSMLIWERLQQLLYNTSEATLATWPFTLHKPHHNSSFSSAQHLSRPDFQTPRTQSRLATIRSPRLGPRRTRYLCLSLQQTMIMWLKKLTQNVSVPAKMWVFSPFFACTDITMSWTFLYRSSDCFNSSILRSCNVCIVQHNMRFTAKANKQTKKPQLQPKVPFLRWRPSVIQLPFSSSALPHLVADKKGNITHTQLWCMLWHWHHNIATQQQQPYPADCTISLFDQRFG